MLTRRFTSTFTSPGICRARAVSRCIPARSESKSGFRTTNCTGFPKPPMGDGLIANASTPGTPKNCGCTSLITSRTFRSRSAQSVSRVKMKPPATLPPIPTTLK